MFLLFSLSNASVFWDIQFSNSFKFIQIHLNPFNSVSLDHPTASKCMTSAVTNRMTSASAERTSAHQDLPFGIHQGNCGWLLYENQSLHSTIGLHPHPSNTVFESSHHCCWLPVPRLESVDRQQMTFWACTCEPRNIQTRTNSTLSTIMSPIYILIVQCPFLFPPFVS